MIGIGDATRNLGADEVTAIVEEFVAGEDVAGGHVVVVVPDGTRTAPMPLLTGAIEAALVRAGAREIDYLVALGTHQPMSRQALVDHLGPVGERAINHAWDRPETFVSVGVIAADQMNEISGGLYADAVDVRVNRLVADADLVLVCGPVFPHEVVGFSGGNKYFFPGVSDAGVIDASHWLGALISSREIIGVAGITPVRRMIDHAASLIPTPRRCLAAVVDSSSAGLHGLYAGTPEDAWQHAATLSADVHIRYVDRPYRTVLSVMPPQYDDLWTAAKGMYKVEPVVADGGEVIIYAPHIKEVSVSHGELLAQVGYHVRDYFLGQWDHFSQYPAAILAHSSHLRGAGTWTAADGERPRVAVTLATSIDAETCRQHGLAYLDPMTIDVADWLERSHRDPSLLVVPKAGETLFRLASDRDHDGEHDG